MSYVPVNGGSQSDVQENVNISFSSSNLKILLAVIAVAIVLYFVYQHVSNSGDKSENYETRSERMIAEARGNVRNKNDLEDELGDEDFSDLSEFSDISNLTEDMENFEKERMKGKKGKKAKKGKKGKADKKLKENSIDDSGDFFEPLSEENYNESSIQQENNNEDREPHVEEQMQENQGMNNMQPGGRMGPGMMGLDGMGSNQLAGIPEE